MLHCYSGNRRTTVLRSDEIATCDSFQTEAYTKRPRKSTLRGGLTKRKRITYRRNTAPGKIIKIERVATGIGERSCASVIISISPVTGGILWSRTGPQPAVQRSPSISAQLKERLSASKDSSDCSGAVDRVTSGSSWGRSNRN